jgi:hypothetical protein
LDSLAWDSLSLPNRIKGITLPHITFGIPKSDSHLFQIFATILCGLMWFKRNKVFHGGSIPDISKLAESIKKNALAHFTAWKSPFELESASWIPPSKGAFKVNFDTTIKEHFSAQAAVCRDHSGRIIKASSQISPSCDLNYGEALLLIYLSPLQPLCGLKISP